VDRTEDFVRRFLEHAGTTYYDPVKAHEYYLKTRELKGRRAASGLKTSKKKEGWAYSKSQIDEAKQKEQETAQDDFKAAVEQLRSNAQTLRKQLTDKIQAIAANTQAQIDALPKIPKGASPELRAQLAEERQQAIDEIRGKSMAKAEREKIGAELKAGIETAREAYKTLKEDLKAKYEAEYQKEYDAIKANV
jgi:hypothetical protein